MAELKRCPLCNCSGIYYQEYENYDDTGDWKEGPECSSCGFKGDGSVDQWNAFPRRTISPEDVEKVQKALLEAYDEEDGGALWSPIFFTKEEAARLMSLAVIKSIGFSVGEE